MRPALLARPLGGPLRLPGPWAATGIAAGILAAVTVAVLLRPPLALGLAAGLAGVLLVLRRPVWGVYALVLSVPVQREISLGGHGTATQAVMAVLLLAWWAWMAVRNGRISLPPFALALVAYLVVMVASLTVVTSMSAGLAEIARWTVVFLAYLIIIHTVRTPGEVVGLVVASLLGGLAEALLGLWQVATRQVPPSFYVGQGGDPNALAPRAFGTIGAPNSYAGYLNLVLPLALALAAGLLLAAWRGRDTTLLRGLGPRRLWPLLLGLGVLATAGLMLGGLLLSYSRGGLIGLGFGLLAMAVALGRRAVPALAALAVGAVVFAGLALVGALPAAIGDRLNSITSQLQIYDVRNVEPTPDNFNQIERLAHWETAGNMFLYSPWIGVGIGNYNVTFPRFALARWPISEGQAHNYYLHALAETGVAGLSAYLILLGTAIGAGWRAVAATRRAARGFETALLIGAFGVVFTIAGHSVFEDLHVLNLGIQWAAIIALFYLVPRLFAIGGPSHQRLHDPT